jgi:hypothetical protein
MTRVKLEKLKFLEFIVIRTKLGTEVEDLSQEDILNALEDLEPVLPI